MASPFVSLLQSCTSAMLKSRGYHLCLPLIRLPTPIRIPSLCLAISRCAQLLPPCCMLYSLSQLHFTSPQAKPRPSLLWQSVCHSRCDNSNQTCDTSQQKASFPQHQHRRYYHNHSHHQSPCLANPPTFWLRSFCSYSSASSPS